MKKGVENFLKVALLTMILGMCLYTSSLYGQSTNGNLPQVFFIGEYQSEYDQLIVKHNEVLLSVHNNSMEKAFNHWTGILTAMEQYAEKHDFDLKGVKIWINIFWDANGKIKHLAFYPKPNSKNIDYEKMKLIVSEFVENYNAVTVTSKKAYSHYGTANFPIFARLIEEK
jgi:hypothetical protein